MLPASQVEGTKCDLIFLFYNPGQPGITETLFTSQRLVVLLLMCTSPSQPDFKDQSFSIKLCNGYNICRDALASRHLLDTVNSARPARALPAVCSHAQLSTQADSMAAHVCLWVEKKIRLNFICTSYMTIILNAFVLDTFFKCSKIETHTDSPHTNGSRTHYQHSLTLRVKRNLVMQMADSVSMRSSKFITKKRKTVR